jgi:hypothetical protein
MEAHRVEEYNTTNLEECSEVNKAKTKIWLHKPNLNLKRKHLLGARIA